MIFMKRISIITCIILLLSSCEKNDIPTPVVEIPLGKLELINSYAIDVLEPSGLSFGSDKETLLTVSDHTNQVYEMDLQGNIIRVFDYTAKDLEGVTYNPNDNIIAIAEEADREITFIDYNNGNIIDSYEIIVPYGTANKGLEGISYNTNNRFYYIVNEMNPKLLICWNHEYGIISEDELSFATDYSGVYVDAENSILWFVSDQSKCLMKCDYKTNVLEEFHLDDLKYEGIVVDNNLIYLVNDATAVLDI